MRNAPSDMPPAVLLMANINVLRCFAGSGIRTTVVANPAGDLALHSRLCHDGHLVDGEPAATLDLLDRLGRQSERPPVLFYNHERTLSLVSRNRERLAPHYRFLMPDAELVESCNDKLRFIPLARSAGLTVPRQISGEGAAERDVADELSFPVILKPATTAGWHDSPLQRRHLNGRPAKMLYVDRPADLPRALALMRSHCMRFVVQEFIPGDERRVHSFHAYVDGAGQPLAWFVGRKVRTWPARGGVSTCLELVRNPQAARLGLEIIERLGIVGPVKIDLKQHADTGEFHVLEVNLRFNLWHNLGARCGVNLPLIAHADLAGRPADLPRPGEYRTDPCWWSIGSDLRALLHDYRPAGMTFNQYFRSLRRPRVCDIFAWSDPWPYVIRIVRFLRRRARRAVRTRPRTTARQRPIL